MTDPKHLPRLYGEKEIGKILKRATELQHEEPSALSADRMTLQELQDIALEAGINPALVRRAAQEIDTGAIEMSTWGKVVGDGETSLRLEENLALIALGARPRPYRCNASRNACPYRSSLVGPTPDTPSMSASLRGRTAAISLRTLSLNTM